MASEGGLWKHRDFLHLWSAQAISAFGSRITRVALPIIAVTTLGRRGAMLGVLAAVQLIPGVVLAMVAGGFVDRGQKRRILIAADLVRAALVVSLTVAWAMGWLTMAQLLIVGAGVGTATALFQITDVAYLPALIGRRKLVEGNAKLETTEAVAEITGPASAGVLITALGAPIAVAIDAATYVFSALLLGRIRAVERKKPPRGAGPVAAQTREDFRIGMRAVFGHPCVRPLIITLMVWSVLGGFYISLYTLFCLNELGLSDATFGAIIAAGGLGSLAGAVLARGMSGVFGVGWTLLITAAISVACNGFIPLAAYASSQGWSIAFLVLHQLISDCFSVAFLVLAVTLRQTVLPRELLGRANAAVHVCTSGVLVVASLASGWLDPLLGARDALIIGCALGMIAPVFLWPLRRLRDMPVPELGASDSALARQTAE